MVAPVASSLTPAMTPSAGGGVLWLMGANLRGGGGSFDPDVTAVVASASHGAASTAASLRAVSSALASFEAPPAPVGPASLSLMLGGGADGGIESLAAAAAGHATLALGFLPGADVTAVSPRVGPSSAAAVGGAPVLAVSGRGFRDTGFAACRLGSVGPLSASVGTSGELTCAVPALAPRAYPLEVSFNRRDYTAAAGMPEFGMEYQTSVAAHPGAGGRAAGMYGLDVFYGADLRALALTRDAVAPSPRARRDGDDASFFYGLRTAAAAGEGGVRAAYHAFYGLLDEEWGLLGGGGRGDAFPGAPGPHGAWMTATSDHGAEVRRQARAVHVLGRDRTVVFTVASPPVALVGVMPSAVPAPAAGGASVTIIGAGFPHGAVPPCGIMRGGSVGSGGAEFEAARWSGAVPSIVSRWGFASCAPGVLAAAAAAPGFVAVAAAAAAAAEPAFARAAVAEQLMVMVFAPPLVDALDPPVGRASGGTLVVVTGRNLRRGLSSGGDADASAADAADADTWGAFGGVAVTLHAVSSAVAFAEAPAGMLMLSGDGAAGTGDAAPVHVIAGGASSTGTAAAVAAAGAATPTFAPRRDMEVHTVTPQRGPSVGGSLITVSGAGFGGAAPLWCRAGTVGPLSARRVDASHQGTRGGGARMLLLSYTLQP